jgi:hypothetical protein
MEYAQAPSSQIVWDLREAQVLQHLLRNVARDVADCFVPGAALGQVKHAQNDDRHATSLFSPKISLLCTDGFLANDNVASMPVIAPA